MGYLVKGYKRKQFMESKVNSTDINFGNTQIAFAHKSDSELKKSRLLFSFMNKSWLVNFISPIGLFAIENRFPLADFFVKKTIFPQFIGGTTLNEAKRNINALSDSNCLTMLDYGVEGKENEEDFEKTKKENLNAVSFAAANQSVPVVTIKVTGLTTNDLVENYGPNKPSSEQQRKEFEKALSRLDEICALAHQQGVTIFIDAEESWTQECIDLMTEMMMVKYNEERAVVYNTFQMYRKDRLQFLKDSHQKALIDGYILGAKLVRGAYMVKERARATELNYDSPIHNTKADTDNSFNEGLKYCVTHLKSIACCNASHNAESNYLYASLIKDQSIPKNHPHVNFCQLYGMSDNITFNLAEAGYNVAKYMPYGAVKEVIPYLIRRAQENASVTGDMSREFKQINKEIKRRKK